MNAEFDDVIKNLCENKGIMVIKKFHNVQTMELLTT